MREAKFKAWDKHRKCWIKDCDLIMEASGRVWAGDINNPPMVQIESENVVFYTGLKDKNGVEIFEGDIVTSEHYPFQDEGDYNYHGIIEWGRTAFHVTKRCVNPKRRGISDGMSDFLADYEDGDFEVIGNIYENPELLEVQA